ncbi:hypothetical protein CQ046_23260 [Chryseobacterium sp. MYb7]|uniref:hypothetical protein n=1 Tax=Chryseobacterium sp. MYb7 TaxID=1827290 RepID=UPI000CFECD61|nr:hypothetical protein [Chryseobacterium sp. MYb7]PRA91393.1 hypothetical protein CQ046_23260 [Chryseobacterium sp. MYb7]
MSKSIYLFSFILIFTTLSICCKDSISTKEKKTVFFLGDKKISDKKYFESLTSSKGYSILRNQNSLYEKNYSNIHNAQLSKSESLSIILNKSISNEKNYKLVLYTLKNKKKIDSIQFYRKVNDVRYKSDRYTCLSYLDLKNKKIWQVSYFSSPNQSLDIISYSISKINKDGTITKFDSIPYLDEALETELSNNKVYY